MKVMLINVMGVFLIVMANLLIFYAMYMDLKDYFERIKNELNNKSIKKKLHDPEELNNIFENLGGN